MAKYHWDFPMTLSALVDAVKKSLKGAASKQVVEQLKGLNTKIETLKSQADQTYAGDNLPAMLFLLRSLSVYVKMADPLDQNFRAVFENYQHHYALLINLNEALINLQGECNRPIEGRDKTRMAELKGAVQSLQKSDKHTDLQQYLFSLSNILYHSVFAKQDGVDWMSWLAYMTDQLANGLELSLKNHTMVSVGTREAVDFFELTFKLRVRYLVEQLGSAENIQLSQLRQDYLSASLHYLYDAIYKEAAPMDAFNVQSATRLVVALMIDNRPIQDIIQANPVMFSHEKVVEQQGMFVRGEKVVKEGLQVLAGWVGLSITNNWFKSSVNGSRWCSLIAKLGHEDEGVVGLVNTEAALLIQAVNEKFAALFAGMGFAVDERNAHRGFALVLDFLHEAPSLRRESLSSLGGSAASLMGASAARENGDGAAVVEHRS